MNTPRFLIGAALVFWGWQTGLLWIGVLMALALEAAHFIATRWEFSITDLNRIYDLCAVLFLGGAAYCFVTRNSTNEVMNFLRATSFTARGQAGGNIAATAFFFFQWWPMFFFPIAAAQAYGTQSQIPFSTFSWYLRRKAAKKEGPSGGINIGFLYLAIVLMATSVTNRPGIWFYLGFCGLAAWALWAIRPARFSPVLRLCITLAAMKAGFWGHNGIRHLQATIENRVSGWVGRMQRGNLNKAETTTGIGQIGEVKASGAIVLRVDPEDSPAPRLLRDASYNTFRSPNWYAVPKAFANVAAEGESATWRIIPDKDASNSVKVAMYMTQGRAVLPVPNGTAVLEGVPVGEVLTNGFGVIRANEGPGLIEFRALYGRGATIDYHPTTNDFAVMDNERPALQQVLAGLNLEGADEREKIQRIDTFFLKNFEYSTYQSIGPPRATLTNTPMGEFLLKTRKGHCEYFATATVLLLREAGIAARYATGYSVQEKEKDGPLYLVRQRHAHAWCLYYDSQQQAWVDFDTTPASWRDVEFAAASPWENFSDFWSNLGYKFSRWRWLSQRADTERYLGAVLIGLVIYLLWRLFYGKERTKRKAAGAQAAMVVEWPGQDSEFFLVEKRLAGLGFVRPEGETFLEWLRRLQSVPGLRLATLQTMLDLHYRYRFDPRGINAAEREVLRKEALAWLEESKEMKAVVAG